MAQRTKPKISSGPLERRKKKVEAGVSNSRRWAQIVVNTLWDAEGVSNTQRWAQIENTLKDTEEVFEAELQAVRRCLLLDVANLRGQDAVSWFSKKWLRLWPETPQDLIELRNELREVWRNDPGQRLATGIGAAPQAIPAEHFLNKWLDWRATAEQEETRRSFNRNWLREVTHRLGIGKRSDELFAKLVSSLTWRNVAVPFKCSLLSRRFLPQPQNLRAMLVQGVLEYWGRLSFCANPDCLCPYFMARRKDQTVCDAEICKAEKQREHARKWWNENRSKKAQGKTNTGGNTATKGSKGNVTRKTR